MDQAELYEVFIQWGAYAELRERFGGDPRTSDPYDLIGNVAGMGHDRAAAAIFAAGCTVDLEDAEHVLEELLQLARTGRRPRYGNEIRPDFIVELVDELASNPRHHEGAGS